MPRLRHHCGQSVGKSPHQVDTNCTWSRAPSAPRCHSGRVGAASCTGPAGCGRSYGLPRRPGSCRGPGAFQHSTRHFGNLLQGTMPRQDPGAHLKPLVSTRARTPDATYQRRWGGSTSNHPSALRLGTQMGSDFPEQPIHCHQHTSGADTRFNRVGIHQQHITGSVDIIHLKFKFKIDSR
jgi:hypothetical protein